MTGNSPETGRMFDLSEAKQQTHVEQSEYTEPPCICTGYGDRLSIVEAAGAVDIIDNPYDVSEEFIED